MNTPSVTLHGQVYTVAINATWAKYNPGTPDRFDIHRDGELLINTVSADEVRERGLGSLLPAPVVAPASASLVPLVAPVGVTGSALDSLPDRRTVWEMRVDGSFLRWCGTLEQFRKDCEEYCDRSKGRWEKVTNTEFRFISPEEPKITHFKAVKKSVDSVVESSATLPVSPVKDSPAKGLDSSLWHCACGTPFDATGSCPRCYDDREIDPQMDAPASPVASVGVPVSAEPYLTPERDSDPMGVYKFSFADDMQARFDAEEGEDGGEIIESLHEENRKKMEAIVSAFNSHAAKDAKIKALEAAVKGLLFAAECADETGYVTDHGFINLDELHESARAALALPAA